MTAPLTACLRPRAVLAADGVLHEAPHWTLVRGRTVALGDRPAGSVGAVIDLPVVVLPGFVNAHAHLDLDDSPPLPASGSFPDWLTAVAGSRRDAHDPSQTASRAAARHASRGVTVLADIDGSRGLAQGARRVAALSGRSDWELLGVAPEVARRRLAHALGELMKRGVAPEQAGLSIHAPYSVAESALAEIARAARTAGRRLSMHLAETEEETRFLLHGDGPFVDFLDSMGLGRPFQRAPGLRPVAYAAAHGLLGPDLLVVHGNDLDSADIELLAQHRAPVVICPGTHRHFARPRHPLSELRAAGVVVAIGTDSRASNAEADLLTDLRILRADRPEVELLELLAMATSGGRAALGLDASVAHFAVGTAADAVFFPVEACGELGRAESVLDALLSGSSGPCLSLHAGRAVLPEGAPPAAFLDTLLGHG